MRALAAQDRQATRTRQRGDVNIGPKDDLDIEWEQLMEAHHQAGYNALPQFHINNVMSSPVCCLLLPQVYLAQLGLLCCAGWFWLSVTSWGNRFLHGNTYVCIPM